MPEARGQGVPAGTAEAIRCWTFQDKNSRACTRIRIIERQAKEIGMDVRDSNGTILVEGDNVTLIKDLKVKGTSETLKRGTTIKGIHLTGDPAEVECRHAKIKGLVLRTEFLKKA